jgi:AraC family transcriptional regulator
MFNRVDIARLAWGSVRVAHLRLPPAADAGDASVALPGAIAVGFNGQKSAAVMLASGRTVARDAPAGTIGLTGGEPVRWLRTTTPAEVVEISADASLRKEIAEELRAEAYADLADIHGWENFHAWAIADRFRSAARGRRHLNDVERDSLVRALYAIVLCGKFGGRAAERSKGSLDTRRLRRVLDFVEAHAATGLTLSRLAEVAALSPFHFARAFKAATGSAPHQYVSSRRLEHARQRLQNTPDSVEAIAAHLGYSNINHFRRQFRAQTGLLPSDIRAR